MAGGIPGRLTRLALLEGLHVAGNATDGEASQLRGISLEISKAFKDRGLYSWAGAEHPMKWSLAEAREMNAALAAA